ncbi:hypothetical protein [Kribbella jejuensis]|uniref:Uncharacterized protein n=1 Tax=Kribbella jejuensis TaxID=236068 RepID=A0A542EB59_9ACTN|nr:hypothetical protein [Kribbella jejuensis]TQJ12535.1 hypothetical protein FB475_5482 [Kribbella jejuensis]
MDLRRSWAGARQYDDVTMPAAFVGHGSPMVPEPLGNKKTG